MKELTHEEWMKNPTPRMMWVWDNNPDNVIERKVIYVSDKGVIYPVISISKDERGETRFKHCAEIEKQRRMTNKELSRWLREKPTRELKRRNDIYVYGKFNYTEDNQDEEVPDDFLIREDDGEWRDPLVEVEE